MHETAHNKGQVFICIQPWKKRDFCIAMQLQIQGKPSQVEQHSPDL